MFYLHRSRLHIHGYGISFHKTDEDAGSSTPKSALDIVKEMKASLQAAKVRGKEHVSAQDVSMSMDLSDLVADFGECLLMWGGERNADGFDR